MKKYFDKQGIEFKSGDSVMVSFINAFGDPVCIPAIIDEAMLEETVKSGLLRVEEEGGTRLDIWFYIEHLAERIKWKVENVERYLNKLYNIYPAAVFSILLREVAIVLDEKYPDHIEKSPEIWYISGSSGRICKMDPKQREKVVNFRNFAAFRTLNDAVAAKHILKVPMQELFSHKRGGK